MSATFAVLMKKLRPDSKIVIFERLSGPALESSDGWNNAGTGHAALCELNYMPDSADGGRPDASKAIEINEQFQISRQFWASLVREGILGDPADFIRSVPHMTMVSTDKDVDYLRRRHEVLKYQPLFSGIEFSEDPEVLSAWMPLVMEGRDPREPIAATRASAGTDVDFGVITQRLIQWLELNNVTVRYNTEVSGLYQFLDGGWELKLQKQQIVRAGQVFVGAGGWALKLLQGAGIKEVRGYGTFPVSGHFLRTTKPELVQKHLAKVYAQAAVGAPPMSVPHLDTRVIDGVSSLLFGPFAGLNPKFLKNGSIFDLPKSIRLANLMPYLTVALKNLPLVRYLVGEVTKPLAKKIAQLRDFVPNARDEDWELYEAGQRAQVIKPNPDKLSGSLQFGTEVICSSDGSIAGLLGASPGASVSVDVMLSTIEQMHPREFKGFIPTVRLLIPSYGKRLNDYLELSTRLMRETAETLKLQG